MFRFLNRLPGLRRPGAGAPGEAAATVAGLISSRRDRVVSTAWALVGLAGPTGLQLVYTIIAARVLSASDAGNFFLVISVATLAIAFVGFGSSGVIAKMVALDPPNVQRYFGQAQTVTALTTVLLLPVVVVASAFFTKGAFPVALLLFVALAELGAMRTNMNSAYVFIAKEQQIRAAMVLCSLPLARLCASLLAVLWPSAERLFAFSVLYGVSSIIGAALAFAYVVRQVGPPMLSMKGFSLRDGFSFAMTSLTLSLQTESDKLILSLFGSPADVAVYTVASRLMDGAAMPPRALKISFQSRLFRQGALGLVSTYRFTLKILPMAAAYGLLVWAGFALLAPVIVMVFGAQYARLAHLLPLLGALPLARALSDYGADIFMTSDRQGLQVAIRAVATLIRVGAGVGLIYLFRLDGAVGTALGVNFGSAAVFWAIAWFMCRGKRPDPPPALAEAPAEGAH